MAQILFRPLCSKCRKELRCVIDYEEYPIQNEGVWAYRPDCINPEYCPYCGTQFDCIEMPTLLPFDNNFYKHIRYSEQEE